jgi:adenosylcobinamide-GDP ribazoletransferase
VRRAVSGAQLAFGFLTVLPVRASVAESGIGDAAPWFPVVGAVVGGAAGAVRFAADHALGSSVAAVLAVLALVVLTGALHQDGLADCADAIGVRGGRERRLEVMRGSTLGAYGVLALVLWALLFVAALAGLSRGQAFRALVVAAVLGRWAAVIHAAAVGPARREGLGAAFVPGRVSVVTATVVALAVCLAFERLTGFAAFGCAIAVVVVVSAWSRRLLGGRTGDTLGAAVALTEAVVCVALLGVHRG